MLLYTLLFACFAAVLAKAEDFGSHLFNISDGTGVQGQVQYCQTYPTFIGWVGPPTPEAIDITADCSDRPFSYECPVFGRLDLKSATNGSAYGLEWNLLAWTVDLPAGTNFSIRIKDVHGVGSGFGHVVPPKGPNPTCNQTLLHRAFEADSMGANYTGTRENQVKVSSATILGGGGWGACATVVGALGLILL